MQAQVQRASEKASSGGLFITHLVDSGANADKVLTALAVATGHNSAPRNEVRHPPVELASRADEGVLRALLAVPFAVEGDLLCVAFAVPLSHEKTQGLPPHRSFVGLEFEILQGLEVLYPHRHKRAEAGPAPSAPSAPAPVAPAAAAPAPALPSLDGPSSFDGASSLDDLLPPPPSAPGRQPLAGLGALPQLSDLPPLEQQQAQPAAAAEPPPPAAAPAGPAEPPPPVASGAPDRDARFKSQLRALRVPFLVAVGLLVLIKVGSCLAGR